MMDLRLHVLTGIGGGAVVVTVTRLWHDAFGRGGRGGRSFARKKRRPVKVSASSACTPQTSHLPQRASTGCAYWSGRGALFVQSWLAAAKRRRDKFCRSTDHYRPGRQASVASCHWYWA
jgi:hypothetical protein